MNCNCNNFLWRVDILVVIMDILQSHWIWTSHYSNLTQYIQNNILILAKGLFIFINLIINEKKMAQIFCYDMFWRLKGNNWVNYYYSIMLDFIINIIFNKHACLIFNEGSNSQQKKIWKNFIFSYFFQVAFYLSGIGSS